LAKFRDPRSARALLAMITTRTKDEADDAQPVVNALLALGEIGGSKMVPEIIEKTQVDNVEIKEAALKVLGMLGDPRAESCLMEALTSDDARIRMQAAESLGYIDLGF
jgi:HEAT repeat protein